MSTGMDWARVDANFPTHPKALRVGPIGELLHLRAICYCARFLTNGLVVAEALEGLLAGVGRLRVTEGVRNRGRIKLGQDALNIDWPGLLVEAGLWERCPEGYRLHDYLQYNPTRDEYEQIMHTKRENGRRGGLATSRARGLAPAVAPAAPAAQANSQHVTVRNETEQPLFVSSEGDADRQPSDTDAPVGRAVNGHSAPHRGDYLTALERLHAKLAAQRPEGP